MSRNHAPVFVLGCPRSGTTLLYHMLLSSGDFAIYHAETHAFNLLAPRFGGLADRAQREELMSTWLKTDYFHRSGLEAIQFRDRVIEEVSSASDFLRLLMESIARKQGMRRWAECTPEHLLYIHEIKAGFRDALVVHMIRDGRDVAMSLAKQGWIRTLPWDHGQELMASALYWKWIVKRGQALGRELGSDYMEVRFEELNRNPHESLARIGAFIDHEMDYEKILKVGLGSVTKPNTSFGADSNGFNPIGRWHNLEPQQLAMLEGLVGGFLDEMGYEVTKHERPMGLAVRSTIYDTLFTLKHWLKSQTAFGRWVDAGLLSLPAH